MVVSIDENILLGVAGLIFVPLVIFLVKLIIDFGVLKGCMQALAKETNETVQHLTKVDDLSNRVSIIEIKVERVEKDLVVIVDKSAVKKVPLED